MYVPNGFKCMECGKKFRSAKSAENAANNGCPKCGGVDIDADYEAKPPASAPVPKSYPSYLKERFACDHPDE